MPNSSDIRRMSAATAGAALVLCAPGLPARAASADFYAGRTITITVGVSPGGGYDLYARLAAQFLGKYIPGDPSVVVVNMPGGGGLRAAMNLYSSAPRDGTTLCAIVQSVGFDSVLGQMPARADAFNFIGRMTSSVETQLIWHTSPTVTLDDAKHRVTVLGATGASSPSSIVPKLLNDALGTRFKVVDGYPGTQDSELAMERGEVEGSLKSLQALEATNRDWLTTKQVRVLWQLGMERHPDFPDVPAIGQLGNDDAGRSMLKLVASTAEIGRSLAAPPGVPAERVAMLRKAFQSMLVDPQFLAAAAQRNAELAPATGETLQTIVSDTMRTPSEVVQRVEKDISAK